jgi:hypothetical protein
VSDRQAFDARVEKAEARARELEASMAAELAEILRRWPADVARELLKAAGVPEVLEREQRLREALALRVPADSPQWQQGGQQTVWIWDEEDREHRVLLGDVEPCGGTTPTQRPDRKAPVSPNPEEGSAAALDAEEAEIAREEEDALVREALSLLLPLAEHAYPECRCYSLSPECPKCIATAALASVGGETTTTKGD